MNINTPGHITQVQYDEAYGAVYEYEKEIADHNNEFLKQFGETASSDFQNLIEDCRVVGKIEFCEGPAGDMQHENYGIFKNVHVDQHSVGDSGDSYAGGIYAQAGDKWISVYYEC